LKSKLRCGVCALIACLSAPAMAADWWWVSGDPEDAAITFVDAESLMQGKARAISVDRSGAVTPLTVTVDCAKPGTAVQRFACASEDKRMNSYAMLGGLDPRAAALALFASGKKDEEATKPRRRVSTLKVAEV
jgi:hypothetical protein